MDRMERKLKKPVTAAADMEELSEDLDVRFKKVFSVFFECEM